MMWEKRGERRAMHLASLEKWLNLVGDTFLVRAARAGDLKEVDETEQTKTA
jgi:hypothetical protein